MKKVTSKKAWVVEWSACRSEKLPSENKLITVFPSRTKREIIDNFIERYYASFFASHYDIISTLSRKQKFQNKACGDATYRTCGAGDPYLSARLVENLSSNGFGVNEYSYTMYKMPPNSALEE